MNDYGKILNVISEELKPTSGCTDIGAIGYAASIIGNYLKVNEIEHLKVKISPFLYKNAKNVGIPGTEQKGILPAIVFGLIINEPALKLTVFSKLENKKINKAEELLNRITFKVDLTNENRYLYLELIATDKNKNELKVIVSERYDNIEAIYYNSKLVEQKMFADYTTQDGIAKEMKTLDLNFVLNMIFDDLSEYEDKINEIYETCYRNYESTQNTMEKHLKQDNYVNTISTEVFNNTFNLSRLRMIGKKVPVISYVGSGNFGIGCTIPVITICEVFAVKKDKTKRALLLSLLIGLLIKGNLNIMTVMCGSGIVSGACAAAAYTYINQGTRDQIINSINSALSSNIGVLCDGAKESCAYKMSSAVFGGIEVAKLSLKGIYLKGNNGINKDNVDKTIENIIRINNDYLKDINKKIIKII